MTLRRTREGFVWIDRLFRNWGWLLLVLLAVFYYGSYVRHDLNLGGEGGTTALLAMRLMEGQRPLVDTYLGYNVLWFFPVSWLFEITGPNYVALRWFFFGLCTITGVLAFLIVRRVSGSGLFATLIGALVILIPGMAFRNYMGLLPVLNAWTFLHGFVFEKTSGRARFGWMAVAGASLGVTYLVRVDVGAFFTVIFAGLLVLFPFGVKGEFVKRLPAGVAGASLALVAWLAVHAPFYLDAKRRGYDAAFIGQYTEVWDMLRYQAEREILKKLGLAERDSGPDPETARLAMNRVACDDFVRVRGTPYRQWKRDMALAAARSEEERRHVLKRKSLGELLRAGSFYEAAFVVILHAPIGIAAVIGVTSSLVLLWALVARRGDAKESALIALVTLGSALTLFPQYFFFRPDTPHLSEFMVPFVVAMACACSLGLRAAGRSDSRALKFAVFVFIAACVAAEALYFYHSFPKESAGTIAARRKRRAEFAGDNGVHVWLKRREAECTKGIYDAVIRHSGPDDWVITYPYSPTINFMTNRRSYLYNLYIDNATAPRDFLEQTIAEIEKHRPAVIVIDHRDINQTDYSRFLNWARPTWNFIRRHYVLVGKFKDSDNEIEIYARPDKVVPNA